MKIAGSGSISQRHGSADPDPYQNVMDPQHCLESHLLPCAVVCSGLSTVAEDMLQARSQLIHILTEALLGDSLAAEYLLCHLVSKVD
jgi:hypothetical protein